MPFAPETTNSVSDGFVEWSETNTQTDQFLGRVLCSHHPALFVLRDSLNPMFRVKISNVVGEIGQAFNGFQA